MLEKYLKMLFSFNLKKNINVLLIILVILILVLLFFGNFNLVEGNVCINKNHGKKVPPGNSPRIEEISNKLQSVSAQASNNGC